MRFDNPIVRRRVPTMMESSALLPRRESSSAYHNWRHIGNTAHNFQSLRNNLSQIQSSLRGDGFDSVNAFHPFKVYNVPSPFCILDGGITAGNSWRTFSMRDGFVSYRSKYGANGNQPIITPASPRTQGNFENVFTVHGTDGVVDFMGNINTDYQVEAYAALPFPFPVQLDGYNETTIQGAPVQFVLTDVANPAGGWRGAGFYLKIIDNPGGNNTDVYVSARMFDDTTGPFPDADTTTIPIAVVVPPDGAIYDPTTPSQLFIYQVQYDHLDNRYPITPGDVGSFLNPRGNWDDDSLSGQYFWPGDVVTVSATSTAGGLTLTSTNCYYHNTTAQIETVPPPGGNWLPLSENVLS